MKPQVAASHQFRRLVVGQAVSSLGDWLGTIAMMALVLDLTGSPTAVGGILALRMAPAAIAGPLLAPLVRGGRRKRTMLAMDLARAGLVIPIALFHELWVIYVFAFATELAGLLFLPARDAAVPELVSEDRLPAANGILLLTSYGNIPLGAGLFAVIAAVTGHSRATYQLAFLIDAATFLVSFLAIRPLHLDDEPVPSQGQEDEAEAPSSVTFRATLRQPLIRALMPSLGAAVVGAGTVFSLGVIFVHRELGAGDVGFGVLVVLFGVGGSAGIGWLRLGDRRVTLALVGRATTALGVILATMSLLSSLPIAYVAAAGFGAAGAMAIVGALTVLQEQLQGDERTMGLAVAHTVFRFGMGTSAIVAGVVTEHIPSVDWWVVGELRPPAIVMFGAGGLIAVAGLMVPRGERPPEREARLV